ncbi:MAG: TonB-dependent receptor, partial [candidate division Zixibacteria bacterium]|nr:TonB-dependent receptor [candidate division Zixibacteria bacterium]
MSIQFSGVLRVFCALALLLGLSTSAFAQLTVGKFSGTVVDKATREPLPAASVRVDGTTMGAMANDKGEYFILNVPPGVYNLIVNVIGYTPVRVTGVRVNADLTSRQNFELETTVIEAAEAVEVVAERPLVEKSLTSSRTIVDAAEIKALPVVNIAEVVLTTAGSFAGNLRGGRAQDQQTTLDGSTVTSQRGNAGQAFTVNPYMIQELEIKTGTFNAEYVNALSGITSVVTKDGGAKFSGNVEFRTLGQKGLNWASPPDMDLVDALRSKELNAADLRALINGVIGQTAAFNADSKRATDGLKLRDPFDVLDTSSANPLEWKAQ